MALEKEYAEQLRVARERAYERNRSRLKVSGSAHEEAEEEEEEEESMAVKISKMTDEEFKALAMERKQRAVEDVAKGGATPRGTAGTAAQDSGTPRAHADPANGTTTPRGGKGGGKGGVKKKPVPLDPKDDPDYRR